jgi:hypothetical protein
LTFRIFIGDAPPFLLSAEVMHALQRRRDGAIRFWGEWFAVRQKPLRKRKRLPRLRHGS